MVPRGATARDPDLARGVESSPLGKSPEEGNAESRPRGYVGTRMTRVPRNSASVDGACIASAYQGHAAAPKSRVPRANWRLATVDASMTCLAVSPLLG